MTKYFQGRPENMIKNRFYSHIKKKIEKTNPQLLPVIEETFVENKSLDNGI